MRRVIALLLLLTLVGGVAGCAAAQPASQVESLAVVEQPMAAPAAQEVQADRAAVGGSGGFVAGPQQAVPDPRKIVYRADLSMVVKDPATTIQQIEDLVRNSDGYVAQSQLSQYTGDQLRGHITVRVPVESYESVLAALRAMAVRVLNENSTAEDVTAEFSDLEAQLRNLEAAERELQAMLEEVRQRPNAKPADILEVYNALVEKRGEIEQVKGRLQYLGNLVALSTITVDLVPDAVTKPVVEEGWQPLVTVKSALSTLVKLIQGLIDLLINLVIVVLPVLLLLALPIVLLVLLVRWLRRRRRAA